MVRYKAQCVEQILALYLFNYWSSTKRLRGKEVFLVQGKPRLKRPFEGPDRTWVHW